MGMKAISFVRLSNPMVVSAVSLNHYLKARMDGQNAIAFYSNASEILMSLQAIVCNDLDIYL